jgi:hypothetical protein
MNMTQESAVRLIGRMVAIEAAEVSGDIVRATTTITRTGPTHEIDHADNGDAIP